MNSFFYDEVSEFLSAFKSSELQNRISETEIIIKGDSFGVDSYIREIAGKFAGVSKSRKLTLCFCDFNSDNSKDVAEFFENAQKDVEFLFVNTFSFADDSSVSFSERELTAFSKRNPQNISLSRMVSFEEGLKKYAENYSVKVIRYTNIFGAEINCNCAVNDIISDFKKNNSIILSENDYSNYLSVSYISAVLRDIFYVALGGKKGNIYNGSNEKVTIADIKNSIYKNFRSKGAKLSFSDYAEKINNNETLSCVKIRSVSPEFKINVDEVLMRTFADESAYIESYVEETYEGKIELIRKAEMGIISEVDRICKENDINYYLVGGSLLGAERNGGFIPWDDDVDICMLREDFEKFRRICPEKLNEKYAYQSYRNEKSTHYIYDKIRLKGTYFSSEHSNKYDDMENGIFLDIFVFDKTANSKLLQKLHVFLIVMLRRFIHVRWTKEAVTGKFAFVSKLILPLICLLPFGFYHGLFEKILRFFEKSKKSRYVLDGIGLYVKKGALPLSWVTENKTVTFEGMELPGVKKSENYLSMWYGENYMTPPELSKRTSGHKISRLDLGEYLYSDTAVNEISLKGELYDK